MIRSVVNGGLFGAARRVRAMSSSSASPEDVAEGAGIDRGGEVEHGVDPGFVAAADQLEDRGAGRLVDDQFPADVDVDGDRERAWLIRAPGRGGGGAGQRHV